MTTVRIILIAFFAALSSNLFAEEYYFKHFNTSNNLPDNSVTCIVQDTHGFIYVGTKSGVTWLDGNTFRRVESDKGQDILNSMIQTLYIDEENNLCVSSVKGSAIVNLNTGHTIILDTNNQRIRGFTSDLNGNLWMICGTEVQKINKKDWIITHYSGNNYFNATGICTDKDGHIWITGSDGDLHRYDARNDNFIRSEILSKEEKDKGTYLRSISAISNGGFLICTNKYDILVFNSLTGSVKTIIKEHSSFVRGMVEEKRGTYLFGTEFGLLRYDPRTKKQTKIKNNPTDALSLSNDNIRCLFKDNNDCIWIGTFYSGVDMMRASEVKTYRDNNSNLNKVIKGNTVRTICQDSNNNIWVGTEDGYLNVISEKGEIRCLNSSYGFPASGNFHSIVSSEEYIIVATYDSGVYFYSLEEEKVTNHLLIDGVHCVQLYRTRNGQILMGSTRGLFIFNHRNGRFDKVEAMRQKFIHTICQDSKGRILIGTYGDGIYVWDLSTGSCEKIRTNDSSYNLDKAYITHLYEDKSGVIWIATEGDGVCHAIQEESGTYVIRSSKEGSGFPSEITCAITQDNNGKIWVSTNMGLVRMNPHSFAIERIMYDKFNRIGNYFRYGSSLTSNNGDIYFGSTQGMLSFNANIIDVNEDYPVYITDITAGNSNSRIKIKENGKSTADSRKIRVPSRQASHLSFSFSSPYDSEWGRPQFRYKFSKGNNVLESITSDNAISFTGITPGKYIFEIYAIGSKSSESSKRVEIFVAPPFYASSIALIIYILIVLAISIIVIKKMIKNRKISTEQYLRSIETEKQNEIYNAKINFFTNITHEIRTPLTLIKMPIDNIIATRQFSKESEDDILTIKANADRLLELTNQLLDLRKIESKQMRLNFVYADICDILKKTSEHFKQAANMNHITLETEIPDKKIMITCASSSIEKIISNLIGNGLKYCRSLVTIKLQETPDDNIVISVFSNGRKISDEDNEKIFEPFYQERESSFQIIGSKGTGLGLPFARTLAELHNGSLCLGKADDGNLFILTIPKSQKEHLGLNTINSDEEAEHQLTNNANHSSGKYYILIVEDDMKLNNYLKKMLEKDYNILQANSGESALRIINKQKVDLVISDIMMPGIDGQELCRKIKSNIEYCHIPVLLLTAAVGMNTRLETLEAGADGYLEKPFTLELLSATIKNLFENREITYKQFTESPLSHFSGMKTGSFDDEFMNNFHEEVMKNLSDPDLCVEDITRNLGTSKSTLFRKVKAYTGLNINEYIKLCRLKKAAELLSMQKYRINEVVYLIGFTSASYFTASFKKQFGMLPSDFIRQMQEGQE